MRHLLKINVFKVFFLIIAAMLAANVYAAGTLVGTPINNTATLSYEVASVAQAPVNSNTASFVVDNKINLSVVTLDSAEVGAGAGQLAAVTRYQVTNLSNSPQDYALNSTIAGIANPFIGGPDVFNPTACTIHVEDGGVAGYQAGQDLATFISNLAPDASAVVYLVCDIPASALPNQVSAVALTASTRAAGSSATGVLTQTVGANNPNAVDIVFADAQSPLAGTSDVLRDAAASAASAYKVGLSVILTKSVLCAPTPACTLAFKAGDTVTYQILVNVTGAGTANNLLISDPIPANLTYTPASIKVNAAARTDATDADNANFSSNTINVNLGNVVAPQTFVIQFKVVIN